MISKKYIDTQTTSCYSLPCLFTLSLEVPSSNADPIPQPRAILPFSLSWIGFPNIPTFNPQTFKRVCILSPYPSILLPTPTL